jgi:hypothetical protein
MHGALMAESPNGAIPSGENVINIYLNLIKLIQFYYIET